MGTWVKSGILVDAILVLTVLEWVGLAFYRRMSGRGPNPLQFGRTILSGIFLLLSLRAALADAAWIWIAAALTAALVAHLADLQGRWNP